MDLNRRKWENKYYLVFLRSLNGVYRDLAKRVTPDNAMSAGELVGLVSENAIEAPMTDLYVSVGTSFALDTISQFKKSEELENYWQAFFQGYVKNTIGTKIVSITGETKRQALILIRRAIEEGVEKGSGIDVIARDIKRRLISDGININKFRSARIARTEVVGASNVGSLEAAKSLGVPMEKTWLASRDARTRDTHAMMDGMTVDINDDFVVNGNYMQGPGEGDDPAEVINCRCTLTYRVK